MILIVFIKTKERGSRGSRGNGLWYIYIYISMFRILSKVQAKPSQAKQKAKRERERERQRKKKTAGYKNGNKVQRFKGSMTEKNRNPKRLRQYKKGVGKKQRYFFFFSTVFQ